MAHETSKVTGFAIDNTAGTLTNISGSVNTVNASNDIEQLDDTGLGDTIRSRVDGVGDAPNISVNGFLNSTTRGILEPLTFTGTSVSNVKTVEIKYASGSYRTGEATVENATMDVGVGTIGTWSLSLRAQGSFTSTSVSAAT